MANEYSINAKITADSSDFQKAVKDASKSLEGMKDSFNKATQNIKKSVADWGLDIDKFYDKGTKIFKDFGIDIDKFAAHFGTTGKVVAAITTASIALTKFGQSMNEARAELAKGTGAVGEDLIKLQDTLHKAMIEGIGRDAKEVGGMMADLNTRFGATEKELVDMTDQFNKFSAVMGVDARQAINDTADVMAKWGIETKDLNPLLDQLTTAAQMSGASINELASGLKEGQSVFSQFGMSATDSIAILSSLAKNGIETNSAITALKYSLNVFSKAGIDAKTGLNDTIEAITNAKTETEALSVACEVFGARNGVEMVKVLKSGSISADEFKTALMNAGGALSSVDRASRTSVDAIEDLKSVLAGTFAGFGEGFDNIFKDLLDSIKDVIQFVAPAIEPIGNIFRDVATAIGEMLRVLVENFIEFEKRYNVVFKAVVNVLKTAYEIIHKVLGNILEAFKTSFSLIFAILDGKWGLAWENAKKLALLFAKSLADILSGIVELFSKMMNGIIEKINSAIDLYHKLPKAVQIFEIGNLDKISEKVDFASKWKITEKLKEVQQEIDKLSGKTAEKVIGDLGKVKTVTEKVADSIKGQSMEVAQFNQDLASNQKGFFDTWAKQYEDLAGNWEKTFSDMANIGTKAMGDMFQQIGQDLANGGIGFENYSAVAVEAISQVLVALSAQITALGVTHALTLDFAGAALAAAGAAAALAAAGALGAVAKSMKSTAEETSAVTAALEEFIKLLNELRSGKLTSSEFASSFVSLRKIVKDTNDYLYKSVELFANVQAEYSKFYDVADWSSSEDMARLRELDNYLEDVKDNLYLATVKQSLALASYNTLLAETVENQKKEIESGKELSDMYETLYSDINKFYELLRNEQMIQVQGLRTSLLESMASLGADIGKMLTDGIKSGASKSDFAESLKELIREKMIEIAVYTEQFQNVLADAGTKLMSGIVGGDDSLIQQAKEQIESLYDTAVQTAEIVDKKLSSIFKSIKNTAKSATSSIAESMKSISETAVTSLRNLAGSQKQISSLLSGLKVQSRSWETVKSVSTSLLKSSANSAKTTLEAAKKNLETQQKALDNASKKLNDSKAKLATAQQNLALSPYYGDLGIAIASQAYNQALLEQTAALKKYEEAEQKKNEAQQKSNSAQLAYNNALSAYEEKLAEVNPYLSQINEAESKYNSLITETKKQLSNENVAIKAQIEAYKDLLTVQRDTVGFQNQIVNVRNQVLGIYDELSASALSLGESLVNAIASGMNKKDFSLELKDYIRQNIIKLNVYGGEMGRTLATAGERLTAAIISQDSAGIKSAKSYTMSAYNEINSLMKNIDNQLDDIFGVAEKTTATVQKTEESVSSLQRAIKSFKESIADLGGDVANNLVSSLSGGLNVDSALLGFKKFLREYIVKSYVFTESMKGEIEKIGKLIGKTLDGSVSKNELSNVANAVKATYGKLADSMKTVDTLLDSVFGKEEQKQVEKTTETVEENLSRIQKAMNSFKDAVSDLGGDIASNLIDGLSNGLSQSDFLSSMKDWIKKMLVQSVVYTEQMKSQIEEIGKAISNAISGGFTETSMHEIRRDLSFIFEQATSKMSGIDKVLGGVFDGYASGTTSALSGLHIVGEAGPELVRFKGGERVYNNADTMKMIAGAGKTNNFNVTFNNLQDTSAFAMMSQLKQYQRELAINGVL